MKGKHKMNIGKILRYAVIGARYESERYADMSVFHDDLDSVKSRYFSHVAERTWKDAEELAKIFAQHSKSEIEFR